MMNRICFGIAFCLLSAAASAQYKYTGPDGKVIYSDQPPPANVKGVQKTNIGGNTSNAAAAAPASALPFALQAPSRNFPVTLYTASSCDLCTSARAHLNKRGIPFSEKTIATSDDITAFKAATGAGSLPVMMLGSGKQVGYNSEVWDDVLTNAGYPATSQLPPGYKQAAAVSAAPEKPAEAKAKPDAAATATAAPPAPPAASGEERPGWFKGF